jgi:hypothetical protein
MFEKMKEKLPGMKGKEDMEAPKKKAMPGIEIEIEGEEEEGMEAPEGMEEEEVAVGELAKLSDEELMAEAEKRGMTISKPEGEGEAPSEAPSEAAEAVEEEVPVPPKKKKA